MKQRITVDQLNELTNEQKLKLQEWWQLQEGDVVKYVGSNELLRNYITTFSRDSLQNNIDKNKYLPLVSIGQMIELLSENNYPVISESPTKWVVFHEIDNVKDHEMAEELCDALWNVVKKVL